MYFRGGVGVLKDSAGPRCGDCTSESGPEIGFGLSRGGSNELN